MSVVTESTMQPQPPTQNSDANIQRSVASIRSALDNISENMNRRQGSPSNVGAVTSSVQRVVSSAHSAKPDPIIYSKDFEFGRAELDSHADTCAVNDTAYVLEYTGVTTEVAPFRRSSQSLGSPTFTVAWQNLSQSTDW